MSRFHSRMLIIALFVSGLLVFSGDGLAGQIEVEDFLNFKDPIEIDVVETRIVSRLSEATYRSSFETVTVPMSFVATLTNQESILVPVGTTTFTPVNTFPILTTVPQPVNFETDFVDLFWFLAANLGPLPPDVVLLDAVMFGALTGTAYQAEITPINDLVNLPRTSPNTLEIVWDLTPFEETTGNFFLAQVTLPTRELIPEPSAFVLFGLGLVVLGYHYRRRSAGPRPLERAGDP